MIGEDDPLPPHPIWVTAWITWLVFSFGVVGVGLSQGDWLLTSLGARDSLLAGYLCFYTWIKYGDWDFSR